jgi:hypothetical protein
MNNNLQKGINKIKEIKMTADEKKRVFDYVMSSKNSSFKKPIQSPWFTYSFMARIQKSRLVYYVVIPLIIILSGGGVAFASENSLPDSILYPIKTGVVEPIRGVLKFSPRNKAKYESSLATTRLVEAETLAGKGKLDKPTEERLNKLLEKHTMSLNKALDKADRMAPTLDSTEQNDEIVTNFHANMNAHAKVLDILDGNQNDPQDEKPNDVKISKTARDNAEKVRSISKNKEEKNKNKVENKKQEKSDKYKKRKEAVQSLLDDTKTELNKVKNKSDSNGHKIIENTNETLNEAQKFLDEASLHEEEGNSEDAYSTLLDSESSVKEAGIFLETGMKFEGGDGSRED